MTIANKNITTDQLIHEWKMGRAVKIGTSAYLHPEYAGVWPKNATLVITKNRAEWLMNQKFPGDVEIDLKNISNAEVQLIIAGRSKKKFKYTAAKNTCDAIQAAVDGELLPALIKIKPTKKLPAYKKQKAVAAKLVLAAEAPLNLRDCGKAKIYAYRADGKASEHLALVVGTPEKTPLVRVHSCCYTGDLLGSLACDCNDQLRGALKLMHKNGGGILVYLMQEGRGIGLINKLRAYKLQEEGLDTVEANEFLGFDDEERGFAPAAEILKKLGVKKIRLISNNPKKAKGLESYGIKVEQLVPMIIKHEHNQNYLNVKAAKSGHLIK